MATTYLVPDSRELREIEQAKLPRLIADRPVLQRDFPMVNSDDYWLQWTQKDNFLGLQKVRGLDGAPTRVKRPGAKRYTMEPGVYGEYDTIDELEIVKRRPYNSTGGRVSIEDLVMDSQEMLLNRRLDRVEQIIWTLLTTGTFSVSTEDGHVLHTDSYTMQSFTAAVAWGTAATATPLADFRSIRTKGRGYSVSFGSRARAYMNSTTMNQMFANANANDLFGRRSVGGGTINGVAEFEALTLGDGLPQLIEYDQGYIDDSSTFQLFIPNNKVVVLGARPGDVPVGEYRMVRNANNPNAEPGAYQKVVDDLDEVPRIIEVHDGHNGGPVIFWPSSVVLMNV